MNTKAKTMLATTLGCLLVLWGTIAYTLMPETAAANTQPSSSTAVTGVLLSDAQQVVGAVFGPRTSVKTVSVTTDEGTVSVTKAEYQETGGTLPNAEDSVNQLTQLLATSTGMSVIAQPYFKTGTTDPKDQCWVTQLGKECEANVPMTDPAGNMFTVRIDAKDIAEKGTYVSFTFTATDPASIKQV